MSRFNLRMVDLRNPTEAREFIAHYIKSEDFGSGYMGQKTQHYNVLVENVKNPAVHILKETMLSLGGDAATHRDALMGDAGLTNVLLMGNRLQMKSLAKKMKLQPFGLPRFAEELLNLMQAILPKERAMPYRGGQLEFGKKTLVMGILNVTPDSFSDGGSWFDKENAIAHALQMEEDGADIIDVGGESTRPGHDPVNVEEEMHRVIPVIEALAGKLKIPISVDSYKAATADAAMAAGAHIINDVWGFQADEQMAAVASKYDCPVILMHNKAEAVYEDLFSEMYQYFQKSIDLALAGGCKREQIILDPGIGFGKNVDHNLAVMNKLADFKCFGMPILLASSRKRTIGFVLDLPPEERVEGTGATVALGIARGADMVRVHDVKEMVRIAKMSDAIVRGKYNG